MKRVLTAVVLGPFIIYTVLWAPRIVFLAVLAAVALLCFHEYARIVGHYGIEQPGPAGYAAGLLLLFAARDAWLLMVLLCLLALAASLTTEDLGKALPRAAALLLGIVYIFGAWRSAIPLRAMSSYWLMFALAVTWVGDIAAYYVGRASGRHKLTPRISPGKSWEGAIASMAASVIFGAIYMSQLSRAIPPGVAIAVSAAGNAAGQIGDLAESALKRGAGVKDSGTMLPGHGGWLDRVDSALFAVPVVYLLLSQLLPG